MQVAICITRSVVVDDEVDLLDIYTAAKDASDDKDTLLEVLELRTTGDIALKLHEGPARWCTRVLLSFLIEIRMDDDARERAFA